MAKVIRCGSPKRSKRKTYFSGPIKNAQFVRRWTLRIYDAWDWLNEIAFGGEMDRPVIVVWRKVYGTFDKKKYNLEGAYSPEKGWIYLNYNCKNSVETLYHEMVHQYVEEVLLETKEHHGRIYWENYDLGLRKIEETLHANTSYRERLSVG